MEPSEAHLPVTDPPIYIVAKPLLAPRRPLPDVIAAALEAGADGVEFPQEVVPVLMNPDDLEDFPQFSAPPVLGAAQPLFAGNQVRHDALLTTVLQARALGCWLVTFPLGAASGLSSETLDTVRVSLDIAYTDAPGVQIAVGSDRAPTGVNMTVLPWLVEQTSEWDHPVHLTFDLDNWIAMGIDAIRAAKELGRYVSYVRVAQSAAASSRQGKDEPITRMMELLPPGVPWALVPEETNVEHARLVTVLSESVERLRGQTP
jgi:sugar phosphate isomerase/epimerase